MEWWPFRSPRHRIGALWSAQALKELSMLKRTMVVGLVLNACLIGAGVAIAQGVDREAKAAADAMVSRFVDSWNRADGAAYGENYWPEAELVNPSGAIRNGKAAIVKEHVDLWAGIFKGTHIAAHVRRIQRLGPNYLIVD